MNKNKNKPASLTSFKLILSKSDVLLYLNIIMFVSSLFRRGFVSDNACNLKRKTFKILSVLLFENTCSDLVPAKQLFFTVCKQ